MAGGQGGLNPAPKHTILEKQKHDLHFSNFSQASGDHGLAFYGHSHNTQSFLVHDTLFGDLCYFCDVETAPNGDRSVTPRDSYRRTVYIAEIGLQIRSDAGTLARFAPTPFLFRAMPWPRSRDTPVRF